MFSQVDESRWSETARFWKAIKSVDRGRWNGDDFIFMTVQLSSTTESNGGNISHLNFRPFARFQQTTTTSASKHTQYQVKKNEHRKLLRSIRAEIITFKLPIFLFMINMNSRCFGMEGGRAQEGGLSRLRDSDIPLRLRESLKWIRKQFSFFLKNIDPRDFGVAVSQVARRKRRI